MEFKYYSINEIIAFFEKKGLSINKKFGQNFLINSGVADTIVRNLNINSNDTIIEIGCGLGSLTNKLLKTECKKLIGIEIDKGYIEHLNKLFGDNEKFCLIEGDFLKVFDNVINQYKNENIVITGNLPYYITTPILEKIFTSEINIKLSCFMMQKEVGQRIVAREGSKKYGSLTIFCNVYSNPKIIANISPASFYPKPNVDSVVVLFQKKDQKFDIQNRELFFIIVRSIFINRRKQIKNNLLKSPLLLQYLKKIKKDETEFEEIIKETLKQLSISEQERGENLPIQKLVDLSNILANKLK